MRAESDSGILKLFKQIEAYIPCCSQEEQDKRMILDAVRQDKQILLRESRMAHMTASAWVVNEDWSKVLMCYHRLYHSWSWLGGHADGEWDLLKTALKEVREESGIFQVKPVSQEIFSLEVLTAEGHEKRGEYISSHLHLNVTFLLEADESELPQVKEDENSDVAWFALDDALKVSDEPWMRERIYKKLNQKLFRLKSQK